MWRGLAFVLALSAILLAAPASGWTLVSYQGRDYVSFADVAEFYHFPNYARDRNEVRLRGDQRALRAKDGSSEFFINGVRFFTCFPLVSHDDHVLISAADVSKIIEPLLRPSRVTGAQAIETVVLDPGHGGDDAGATVSFGAEKDFTLDLALRARAALLREGFKVEMTRSDDHAVSLPERAAFANRFAHAVFICLHFNAAQGASGLESYALSPDGAPSNASSENHPASSDVQWHVGNAVDAANMALTAALHGAILKDLRLIDRGVRHARFHVLRDVKIPSTLIEGGFLSDPTEGPRIANPEFRERLATAIAQGVATYNRAVNYRSEEPGQAANNSSAP